MFIAFSIIFLNGNLYPEIEPFDSGMLKVSDLHTIYYERVGNPDGIPVVFLHGGPGGGLIPMYRQFFDPAEYHVILFDQRGSGTFDAARRAAENTTWDLINDIETLREKFGIDKWYVFGGSWGSTLSLAYAETHPDRCLGLILRGIFLTRRKGACLVLSIRRIGDISGLSGNVFATRSRRTNAAILCPRIINA